jgi:hypothetical protein
VLENFELRKQRIEIGRIGLNACGVFTPVMRDKRFPGCNHRVHRRRLEGLELCDLVGTVCQARRPSASVLKWCYQGRCRCDSFVRRHSIVSVAKHSLDAFGVDRPLL